MTRHRAGGSKGGNAYGSYQVRYASDKQKDFIKKLLQQKEYNLSVDLSTLNVQGAGELITNLLSLPDKVGFVDYASEKQVSFAQSLSLAKEGGQESVANAIQLAKVQSLEQLSKKQISLLINELRAKEDKKSSITQVGAYLYDDVVYSIRKNQNDKFILWTYNEQIKKYERNYSATKKLLNKIQPSDRLTLEQAEKYSAQTGLCCHCGRTLTVMKSIAGGIGPICAKQYIERNGVSAL